MILVNIAFILIIVVMVLEGIHRGFLRSALGLGAFFLSLVTSFLFYPVMSSAIKDNQTMFDYLYHYTEGAEKIANFQDTLLRVDQVSAAHLNEVLSSSNLSEPFVTLVRQNVESQSFAADGLYTLGEYFNMTLVSSMINLMSFIIVFLIARIIYAFVLGAVDYTVKFPELRQYDRTMGALFGSVRGVLFCFLVASVIPVLLLMLPVDKILEYYHESSLAVFFTENNFFWPLIRSVI